jgi:copper chaperone NosL
MNFAKFRFFILGIVIVSCSKEPQAIVYGKDNCNSCKMRIEDKHFAAELISKKGKAYKFDDIICMIDFIKSASVNKNDIDKYYVNNYTNNNEFIDAEKAIYFLSETNHSPMNGNAAAFVLENEANNFALNKEGKMVNWAELFDNIK